MMKKINPMSVIAAVTAWLMVSCSTITENLQPCGNYVRFTYTMNMKYVDAFDVEVKRVDLFVFDENDRFVTRLSDEKASFGRDYRMPLDLKSGKYHLVAWAGLYERSYIFPEDLKVGESTPLDLKVMMRREADAMQRTELDALWHSETDFEIVDNESRTTVMDLCKDTNKLRIVVQGEQGMGLSSAVTDFETTIRNGHLNYDNSLLDDEVISYKPYFQQDADLGDSSVSAVVAEMNVLRLMEHEPARLVISDNAGHKMVDIDLVKYLLLTKMEGHAMSSQEYLDRQDEYAMIFFLNRDAMGNYLVVKIQINDWVIRPQDGEL